MAAVAELVPRKRPAQARSRATVEVILEAAARILVEGGHAGFTTNKVAERAGVSVGSLYQYFPNKAALLGELERRHGERMMAHFEAAAAERSIGFEARMRGMIRAVVAGHLDDFALHAALSEGPTYLPGDSHDAALGRATEVVAAMLAAEPDADADRSELAAFVIVAAVDAAVHAAAARRPETLADGRLEEELARLIAGYVRRPPPG